MRYIGRDKRKGGFSMGEKILKILLEVWADQNGLEIRELTITEEDD